MASGIVRCVLRSRNYKHRDVLLPHNSPIIVGRGPQTRIRERRCSKAQVEITADYNLHRAFIVQLGTNSSEVDDKVLHHQQKAEAFHGSSVNLLKGELQYTLEFVSKEGKGGSQSKTKHTFKLNDANDYVTTRHEKSGESGTHNHLLKGSDAKRSEKSKRDASCDDISCKKPKQDAGAEQLSDDDLSREDDISAKLASMRESFANTALSTTEEKWEEYDHSRLLIYTSAGLEGKEKVAAFDLDHTIISTKSGRVFPTSMDDWKIMYAEIPGKLKKMCEDGFKIVIFTNQKGISKGKTSVPEFKQKVKSIIKRIGIPIQVLVSTGSGRYRKPNTGMWDYFISRGNQGVPVDLKSCIYVGDAAGRPESKVPIKRKKDFSCADRLFALNAHLKFYTPEEFFLGHKPSSFQMPSFDPRTVGNEPLAVRYKPASNGNSTLKESDVVSSSSEVVVCVGFPASGKTHFVENYLVPKGYVHVNRDTLGTWQKCLAECSKALEKGRAVVIDNTNPDVESRLRYIQCAQKCNVPCRCFLFSCSLEQAKHNNVFRELNSPDKKHAGVNDMVLNSYKSKYKEPTLEEGFKEILKINFVPKFKTRNDEELFRKFLIEK